MSGANAIRDRLRDQPLPGEAEAAARSWPVVEAALARARPGRPPQPRAPPAGARARASVRGPRHRAVPGRRVDRRPVPPRAGQDDARLRRASPGRLGARHLAERRVCDPAGRQLAPAGRVLRGRLVAARAARGGGRGPPADGGGRGRDREVDAHEPAVREPPGVEHRGRLRGRLPRGPLAEGGGRQRRPGHQPGAAPRRRTGHARLAPAQRPRPHLRDHGGRARDGRRPDRPHPVDIAAPGRRVAARAGMLARLGRRRPASCRTPVTLHHGPGPIRSRSANDLAARRDARDDVASVREASRRGDQAPRRSRVLEVPLAGGAAAGAAARRAQLFQGGVDGIAWSQDGRRLLLSAGATPTSGSCSAPAAASARCTG